MTCSIISSLSYAQVPEVRLPSPPRHGQHLKRMNSQKSVTSPVNNLNSKKCVKSALVAKHTCTHLATITETASGPPVGTQPGGEQWGHTGGQRARLTLRLAEGRGCGRVFVQDSVKTPNGLPLGFPIQVDSANRCYRNVNQSLHSCRHFRKEFFNKISPSWEDMKNHQPSFLGLFSFQLTFWEKEVNRKGEVILPAVFQRETEVLFAHLS